MGDLVETCGEVLIYSWGTAFLAGALFAIFIMLIFDMIKKILRKDKAEAME